MFPSAILASLNFNKNKMVSPGLENHRKDGELRDKSVPYFQQESGPCPLDLRITINSNVDLVFFQQS